MKTRETLRGEDSSRGDAPNLNMSLLLRKNFKEKLKFKY